MLYLLDTWESSSLSFLLECLFGVLCIGTKYADCISYALINEQSSIENAKLVGKQLNTHQRPQI